MAAVADDLLVRINRFGVGAWLAGLFASSGQNLPDIGAVAGSTQSARLTPGLTVTLVRAASSASDPRDGIVLARVEGDDDDVPPLGLDAGAETVAGAAAKLSRAAAGGSPGEIAAGDRRVSFFVNGGRIVELRSTPSMVGFDRFVLARLGVPVDPATPRPGERRRCLAPTAFGGPPPAPRAGGRDTRLRSLRPG